MYASKHVLQKIVAVTRLIFCHRRICLHFCVCVCVPHCFLLGLLYFLIAVKMEETFFPPQTVLLKGLMVMSHCSNLSVPSSGDHVTVLLQTKLAMGPLLFHRLLLGCFHQPYQYCTGTVNPDPVFW